MQRKNCASCNQEFFAASSMIKKGYAKFCSQHCFGISRKGIMIGDKNPSKREEVRMKISLANKGRPKPKGESSSRWKGGKSKFICHNCDKEFLDYQSNRTHRTVLCSRNCQGEYYTKSSLIRGEKNPFWKGGKNKCMDCNKTLSNHTSIRCRDCLIKYWIGENAPNWQGGKTVLSDKIRTCAKYRDWRNTIFQRDNYTCQVCGKRNGAHNVDHIKPFALILKENQFRTFEDSLQCSELWDLNNGRTLCIDCHKQTPTYLNNKFLSDIYATQGSTIYAT